MNRSKIDEAKVGFITFVGLILLGALILFTKGLNFGDKSKELIIEFDNSAGITPGSPVVMQGVDCGIVNSVWNEDGKVKINVSIKENCEIYEDATAVISMLEITGGKKIEIDPGKSKIKFDYSKTLPGICVSDISSMLTEVTKLGSALKPIIYGLDSTIINLNSILNNKELVANLEKIVTNTESMTEDLSSILTNNKAKINSIIDKSNLFINNLDKAVVENKPEVEQIIHELNIATNSLNSLLVKVDTTVDAANKLIDNSNVIISDIKGNNGGTVSKLIYDKQFTAQIEKMVVKLDSLLDQIQKYGVNVNTRLGTRP